MNLYLKKILDRKTSSLVANKMLEEHRKAYPRQFIGQRLLVDYAFQNGMVTTNEVLETVSERIRTAAKKKKQRVAWFLGAHGDDVHYFLYEQCVSYVMDKVIKEKIPPKMEVDADFVAAVKKQVQAENTESRATNAVLKAELENLRSQIIFGKTTFSAAAGELEKRNLGEGGEWGEFTADDFDNTAYAMKVFTLKQGEVSEVMEDEDGFRIVRVEKILPQEKNTHGDEINPERRLLLTLHIDKHPILIEESDIALTKDLKQQMQLQAINEFVSALSTNQSNHVVYPAFDKK